MLNPWFCASIHRLTTPTGSANSVGVTVGDGLTVTDELEADAVGSAKSGSGSSSEQAPSRHIASNVASVERVRIMRSTPEKREP